MRPASRLSARDGSPLAAATLNCFGSTVAMLASSIIRSSSARKACVSCTLCFRNSSAISGRLSRTLKGISYTCSKWNLAAGAIWTAVLSADRERAAKSTPIDTLLYGPNVRSHAMRTGVFVERRTCSVLVPNRGSSDRPRSCMPSTIRLAPRSSAWRTMVCVLPGTTSALFPPLKSSPHRRACCSSSARICSENDVSSRLGKF